MTPDLIDGLKWYVAFLFSTTCHEAAHAWTSYKLGDDTAHRGGQVTLNPLPHIQREPFGMVLVPIVSFLLGGWMIGWASAPYDPNWALNNPRKSGLTSLAGPVANFIILLLAGIALRVGLAVGGFATPLGQHVQELLLIFFMLNLLLGTFNLLPLPPLDGSGVVLLFLPAAAAEKYLHTLWNPAFRIFGLFVAWKIFGTLFPYIQAIAFQILMLGA